MGNVKTFCNLIDKDRSQMNYVILIGGGNKDLEKVVTKNLSINDQNIYDKTLQLINNLKSTEYREYLENVNDFYEQKKKKGNLKKNDYYKDETGRYVIEDKKTSDKNYINIPEYYNTKEVINYLSSKLDNISFEIRNLRDTLLKMNSSKLPKNYDTLVGKFDKLREDYVLYNTNLLIYNQYNDIINNISENKNNLDELIKQFKDERIKYNLLNLQLTELYVNDDLTDINSVIDQYLDNSKYKEILNAIHKIKNSDNRNRFFY